MERGLAAARGGRLGSCVRALVDLVCQVKNLEGQLADFNLAMNRVRHNMPVEELKEMYNRTKEKNDQERRQIDQIFLQAAQVENEARELDNQLAAQYVCSLSVGCGLPCPRERACAPQNATLRGLV